MHMRPIQIMPSLLAADHGNLEEAARRAEASGADALHVDVMDGHFVPNLSLGPEVVCMARRVVRLPLSVHLMMSHPERYLERFVSAGAGTLLIHIEVGGDTADMLREIRRLGARPGITLNPETPAEGIAPVLTLADEVLCMTVQPGYGGQDFLPEVLPKITAVRRRLDALGRPADLSVDGGIDPDTAPRVAAAGANILIAGTSLYNLPDMRAGIAELRRRAEAGRTAARAAAGDAV
jgi:ribulose-phosphate 3-epimerase